MSSGPRDSWRHELGLLGEELHALDVDIAGARAAAARGRYGTLSFKHQERESARVHGEPVRLSDGAQIVIRALEPEDAGELRRGLKRLSALTAASTTSGTRRSPRWTRWTAASSASCATCAIPPSPRRPSSRMWSPTRGSTAAWAAR